MHRPGSSRRPAGSRETRPEELSSAGGVETVMRAATLAYVGIGILVVFGPAVRAGAQMPPTGYVLTIRSLESKVAHASAVLRGVVVSHRPEMIEGESFATVEIR